MLRYETTEQFGPLRIPKFRDDADGTVTFIEDPELAIRLGAPDPNAPPAAPGLIDTPGLLASNDVEAEPEMGPPDPSVEPPAAQASDVPQRPGIMQMLSGNYATQYGDTSAPARTPQASAEVVKNMDGPKPAAGSAASANVDPSMLRPFGRQSPQYAPARTIKVSDGGMMPVGEQSRVSGPLETEGWSRDSAMQDAAGLANAQVETADNQRVLNNEVAFEQAKRHQQEQNRMMFERMDRQRELEREQARTRWEQESIDNEIQRAQSLQVDPDRLERRRGTVETVLSTIGLVLSGLGGVESAKSAIKILSDARAADIERQEKDIATRRADANQRMNDFQRRLQTGRSPEVVRKELDIIQQAEQLGELQRPDTARIIQQNGIDHQNLVNEASAQLQKSRAELASLYQAESAKTSKFAPAQYVQVGGAPTITEQTYLDPDTGEPTGREFITDASAKEARALLQRNANMRGLLGDAKRLISGMSQWDKLPSEQAGKLRAQWGLMVPQLSLALQQGVVRAEDKFLPAMLGSSDPTKLLEYAPQIIGSLNQSLYNMEREKVDLENTHTTPLKVKRD